LSEKFLLDDAAVFPDPTALIHGSTNLDWLISAAGASCATFNLETNYYFTEPYLYCNTNSLKF